MVRFYFSFQDTVRRSLITTARTSVHYYELWRQVFIGVHQQYGILVLGNLCQDLKSFGMASFGNISTKLRAYNIDAEKTLFYSFNRTVDIVKRPPIPAYDYII